MEQKICQSCGLPITSPEEFGTDKKGAHVEDYCLVCYEKGKFARSLTMPEMAVFRWKEYAKLQKDLTGRELRFEEAVHEMRQFYPNLKRWIGNTKGLL